MYIYAFGSICRGEVSLYSDIDLLAVIDGPSSNFDPEIFSIYKRERIKKIWSEGNPFAWHLFYESRLIFSSDKTDYLKSLGTPSPYKNYVFDCRKFFTLFSNACKSINTDKGCIVFDLSTIFLSIRNIASCYSLGVHKRPVFSRDSALRLGAESLDLPKQCYSLLERARLLSTRGMGEKIGFIELDNTINNFDKISIWMKGLVQKARNYG